MLNVQLEPSGDMCGYETRTQASQWLSRDPRQPVIHAESLCSSAGAYELRLG